MNKSQKESAAKDKSKAAICNGNIRRESDNKRAELDLKRSHLEVWDFDKEKARA